MFTGRFNAFRVIERLEKLNILGGQNTESVNIYCMRIVGQFIIDRNIIFFSQTKLQLQSKSK